MHLACHIGDLKTVQFLLESGANPLEASTKEATCLHVCAEKNLTDICKLIIRKSTPLIFKQDIDGNTPLHLATERNNIRLTEMII